MTVARNSRSNGHGPVVHDMSVCIGHATPMGRRGPLEGPRGGAFCGGRRARCCFHLSWRCPTHNRTDARECSAYKGHQATAGADVRPGSAMMGQSVSGTIC